jgi:hypothetical protein
MYVGERGAKWLFPPTLCAMIGVAVPAYTVCLHCVL